MATTGETGRRSWWFFFSLRFAVRLDSTSCIKAYDQQQYTMVLHHHHPSFTTSVTLSASVSFFPFWWWCGGSWCSPFWNGVVGSVVIVTVRMSIGGSGGRAARQWSAA